MARNRSTRTKTTQLNTYISTKDNSFRAAERNTVLFWVKQKQKTFECLRAREKQKKYILNENKTNTTAKEILKRNFLMNILPYVLTITHHKVKHKFIICHKDQRHFWQIIQTNFWASIGLLSKVVILQDTVYKTKHSSPHLIFIGGFTKMQH